jgi:hypothetical protein
MVMFTVILHFSKKSAYFSRFICFLKQNITVTLAVQSFIQGVI